MSWFSAFEGVAAGIERTCANGPEVQPSLCHHLKEDLLVVRQAKRCSFRGQTQTRSARHTRADTKAGRLSRGAATPEIRHKQGCGPSRATTLLPEPRWGLPVHAAHEPEGGHRRASYAGLVTALSVRSCCITTGRPSSPKRQRRIYP